MLQNPDPRVDHHSSQNRKMEKGCNLNLLMNLNGARIRHLILNAFFVFLAVL